jgi:hypothetical protein
MKQTFVTEDDNILNDIKEMNIERFHVILIEINSDFKE